MHGTYEANLAMHGCDVMLNVGARFDDRVTGRLNAFSPDSRKIHIDIDPSSINKNVAVEVPVIGDAGLALEALLEAWDANPAAAPVCARGQAIFLGVFQCLFLRLLPKPPPLRAAICSPP
jgi:thiamine pyrophosphate-dependent acetolactate synthase large subunit-like protein